MKILFLDLAEKTGWATNAQTGIIHGVQDFSLKRGESPGMKFLRFENWLDSMCEIPPDLIAYEQPLKVFGYSTEVLNGFVTITQKYCAKRGIEHQPVWPGTLKKWWTGSGRASKDDMLLETNSRRRGFPEVKDHNESDAIAGLHLVMAEFANGNQA